MWNIEKKMYIKKKLSLHGNEKSTVKWTECNQYQGHKYAEYKHLRYIQQEGNMYEEVNRFMTSRICKHLTKNLWVYEINFLCDF